MGRSGFRFLVRWLTSVFFVFFVPFVGGGQENPPVQRTGHSQPVPTTEPAEDLGEGEIPNADPASSLLNLEDDEDGDGVSITPYGSVWGNLQFATRRTNPDSFTLWVFSEDEQGEPALDIDARRSRVGIDVAGPKAGFSGYQLGGKVEVDFYGQFLTENRAGARLRHAYFEATGDEWRFLVGQTWDVISPLNAGMLNFSPGWAGGNIGFRRAQFRVERTVGLADGTEWLLQGSLNQTIVDDFPADPGVRRESSIFPVLQARTAVQLAGPSDSQPVALGISGHYGETGFDFIRPGPPPLNLPPADDTRFPTWSVNLDLHVPLSSAWILRGEAFGGANLSPFFGGIGQGVCPCLRKPIRSTGGWLELVRIWSPAWESHFGLGIDDPRDEDSLIERVQNQFVFGNLIWQVTEELSTGWEIAYWRTLYQERRAGQIPPTLLTPSTPGDAVTLEWMVRYDF